MSSSFCVFHLKEHDDFAWKYMDYTDNDGKRKSGWFCREAFHPSPDKERIPEKMKNDREEFAKSMIQPFREGVASKEFIEAYPEQAKRTFSPKDMAGAKYVWEGDVISKHWRKTK